MNVGYLVKRESYSWRLDDCCWEFCLEKPEGDDFEYRIIAWEYLKEKENFDD